MVQEKPTVSSLLFGAELIGCRYDCLVHLPHAIVHFWNTQLMGLRQIAICGWHFVSSIRGCTLRFSH